MLEYLQEFAIGDFEATAQPSQTGLQKRTVADLQNILIKLGWKATTIPRPGAKDFGLYGPKTAGAWGQSATTRKLNPTFQRASATEAYVDPNTLAALFAAAGGGAAVAAQPAVQTTTVAPVQPLTALNTVTKGAREINNLLYGVGWTTKKLPKTDVYTKSLANAWATSAKLRNMPVELKPTTSPAQVFVHKDTYDRIAADATKAKVATDAPAAEKVVAGSVVHPVLHLQELLYGVGWTKKKLAKDGKYGPQTAKAWGISAKTRKLPGTFERIDGKTVRVAQATYEKIKADAALAPVPAPYVPPAPTPSPVVPPGAEILVKPVADAQNVLIKLGWKATSVPRPGAKDFGLFGPKTKAAWESSAKSRNLDTLFERVDGKTVKVSTKTYVAMLEEAQKKSKTVEPTPTPAPSPVVPKGEELLVKPVADAQNVLIKLGWKSTNVPRPSAKDFGLFGPKTKAAWESSAKSRKLDPLFERVDGRTVKVSTKTYVAMLEESQKGAGPAPTPAPTPTPTPADSEVLAVRSVQQALNIRAKAKLVDDGTWGPKTEKALRSWLDKQPGGKKAKIVVISKAKNASTVQLPKAFAAILRDTSNATTPEKPATSAEDQAVAFLIKGATVPVPVLHVQHMLAIAKAGNPAVPSVEFTGSWDKATFDAYMFAVKGKLDASFQKVWRIALPKMVSPDAKTVMLSPTDAEVVALGEKSWQSGQKVKKKRDKKKAKKEPVTPQDDKEVQQLRDQLKQLQDQLNKGGGSPAPTPTPAPNGGGGGGGGGYASGSSSSGGSGGGGGAIYDGGEGGGPTPGGGGDVPGGGDAPTPPVVAANNPAVIWDQAVEALRSVGTDGPRIAKAIEDATASGGTIRPEVLSTYTAWQAAVERLKQRVASILEKTPQAITAMDAAGGASPGLSALEAYFGELAGPGSEALDLLKSPLFSAPMQGLGQVAQAAGWAARVAGPLWAKMIELLQLPVVKSAVVTGITVQGVGDALNAETVAFSDVNQQLNNLVAEGKLTAEQADQLRPETPTSPWTVLALAGVALGGGYLYLRNKKRA